MESNRIINFLLIIFVIKSSWSQRKIRDGILLDKVEKKYAIFFMKSEKSTVKYEDIDWVCAGALVTKTFIVTAAACLEDVHYLYAVGGLKGLVKYKDLHSNGCTKWNKKKVIYTCVPRAYEFDYANVEKWSAIDIGVAKIESEYKITQGYCDYDPTPIPVNYDPKYQEPGVDAIVMGWGHNASWRHPEDRTRLLSQDIHYASVSIMKKKKCKEGYSDFPELQEIIDKYMICTISKGNLDSSGDLITTIKPEAEGCSETKSDECRRNLQNKVNLKSSDSMQNRRQGICQNDHGGPLVTWIGGKEYLIGVASVFRVNAESKCEGPYLYTSTQCNGAFLSCILNPKNETRRGNSICDLPAKERGFEFIHKHISWANHSDGPADNENISYRPLIPLRNLYKMKKSNIKLTDDEQNYNTY